MRTLFPAAVALCVVAAACGGAPDRGGRPPAETLAAEVASFDLAVGDNQRFMVGLFTPERQPIGFGEVTLRLFFLGERKATEQPQPVATTTAVFLPVPGKEPAGDAKAPKPLDDPQAAGVYETTVDLPRPGLYEVAVDAQVAGEPRHGTASFRVAAEHEVAAVGEPAPKTDNLTLEDADAPKAAIDSRAVTQARIPDPHLHRTTVRQAIADGRPAVVVFSTPTYCASRFCGPITDTVGELATTYADRAAFIHVEIWRDFNAGKLNKAAATWIQTATGGGKEPWVFVIDGDGTIVARWDNVLDRAELQRVLERLPA